MWVIKIKINFFNPAVFPHNSSCAIDRKNFSKGSFKLITKVELTTEETKGAGLFRATLRNETLIE